MSLFTKLRLAFQAWRRRRAPISDRRRPGVAVEHLDHRQLLTINFTGNVLADFPVNQQPGAVFFPAGAVSPLNPVVHPSISPDIAPIVKVSGFDLNGIAVSYDPVADVLSVGLDQPQSQNHPGEVIAGDADNNGNDGTVNPAITSMPLFSSFQDFPNFGGSEQMGAFLDLNNTGYADVVAGFAPIGPSPKPYQVAHAIVNRSQPPTTPDFDPNQTYPFSTGTFFKQNSITNPNLEFTITNFSQLYHQVTGKALTPQSIINIGAFAGSDQDIGIGEAFFPEQSFILSQATQPPTPTTDLSIVKTSVPTTVTVGQNLAYVLTVANSGPASASDVVVTDPLPAGETFVGAVPSQGTASVANGLLTANLGAMAPGATAQITVVVDPTVPGTVTNTATVAGTPDTNPNNNTSTATTLVNPAPPPPVCPPVSPMILVNPHAHRHVNTAHPSLIRVNVLGTSGFDAAQIDPATARLGGAAPINFFTRFINRDEFPDATLVFLGDQVSLPPGITTAELTGQLKNGTTFASSVTVFDRNPSFYSPGQIAQQQARQAARSGLTTPLNLTTSGGPTGGQGLAIAEARANPAPIAASPGPPMSDTTIHAARARTPTVRIPGLAAKSQAPTVRIPGLTSNAQAPATPRVDLGSFAPSSGTTVSVGGA